MIAKYKLSLFGLIFLVLIYKTIPIEEIFALSPSFPRQEITDPDYDWSIINTRDNMVNETTPLGPALIKLEKNSSDCMEGEEYGFHPPDISAVTYLSDGKTLNATIWFSDFFIQPSNLHSEVSDEAPHWVLYAMSIDAQSVYDTQGTDYTVKLLWTNWTSAWTKTVQEHGPTTEIRVLSRNHPYTGFFGNDQQNYKGHVDLSLNLGVSNYPDQYSLFFYAYDFFMKHGRLCRMADITNKVFVPPPQYNITTSENNIEMRPNEEKDLLLQIKGNTNVKSQVILSANHTNDINLSFNTPKFTIPPYGLGSSSFRIKIPSDAKPEIYSLPIFADIITQTEVLPRRSSLTGETFSNSKSESIVKESSLTIRVNSPLTLPEQIKEAWDKLGSPIIFVYGIIAATVPWVINEIRKKLRKKYKNVDEYL